MVRVAALLCLVACTAAAPVEERPDAGAPDAGSEPPFLPADSYCERIQTRFCEFYLRCGRVAATGMDDCRRIFHESCETKYEPRYVDLERAGLLRLSTAGVDACLSRLAVVACEAQPYDLAGPCAGMWAGTTPAGSPCGLDIESLVCEPGAACRLGPSLCGTCVAVVDDGMSCDANAVCRQDSECTAGTCVARPDVAGSCDDQHHCRLGMSCTQGSCHGPTSVAVGDVCDQVHRCPYRSSCISGRCAASALLGESCGALVACADGRCGEAGTCEPPLAAGAPCTASGTCLSGLCLDGRCEPLPGRCIVR